MASCVGWGEQLYREPQRWRYWQYEIRWGSFLTPTYDNQYSRSHEHCAIGGRKQKAAPIFSRSTLLTADNQPLFKILNNCVQPSVW